MSIPQGTLIGRYEIRAAIGAGGMGAVYLTHDAKLDRPVALKILPAEFTRDEKRLRRFEQEARVVSKLNHPNVAHIYEVGEDGDLHFMAMEYVEGETLRQYAGRVRRLTFGEALDIGLQVAAALAAAADAGIVHRDVKPENIMLRRDGYVKVVDFGLAKLTERWPEQGESGSGRGGGRALVNTDPGAVMGTVNYMSPEQARGLQVDARTDLWSFGVVLYEMLGGQAPFDGPTAGDIIVSILEREPPPLARYAPEVPAALQAIIDKLLRKDRDERYQTPQELLGDLKALRQQLDFEAQAAGGVQLTTSYQNSVSEELLRDADGGAVKRTGETRAARHTASTEYLTARFWRTRKKGLAALLAAAVVLFAAAGLGLYQFSGGRRTPEHGREAGSSFEEMKINRLTTTGKAIHAAISPDGKYVAHVMNDGGQQSLLLRPVSTANNVLLVPPAPVDYWGLTFTRDGNYIYYVTREQNGPGVLYQLPALGGTPRRVMQGVDSPVTFSPDGKSLAFVRGNFPSQGESALVVAGVDGSGERALARRKLPEFFSPVFFTGPSWSPDGQLIACGVASYAGRRHAKPYAFRVDGSGEQELTSQHDWFFIGRMEWLADGSGLVMIAAEEPTLPRQVWLLPYPTGEARRVTNDLNDYRALSLTADSQSLVTVQYGAQMNVWLVPSGGGEAAAARARQITSGKLEGFGLSWTPDGKIVYGSDAGGTHDIWVMGADGTGPKQLTFSAGINRFPAVAPDGRTLAFVSDRAGPRNIWRMSIDGSGAKRLTEGYGEQGPNWSPDGQWVVYSSFAADRETIWKVPAGGGAPAQLTTNPSSWPTVSPDGRLIACYYREEANAPMKIALIPFEGGAPVKLLDLPPSTRQPLTGPRWSVDGRSLYYVRTEGETSNLWSQPVDGGPPRQVTDFKSELISNFDWSRDFKQLAVTRGISTRDVILISNFR